MDRELMNFAFWHIWVDWVGAILFGVGILCGFISLGFFRRDMLKELLKIGTIAMVFGFIFNVLIQYIRFVYIWKDVMGDTM